MSCRRCRRSTTFVLEIYRYEASETIDDPKAFQQATNLNSSLRTLSFVSLKDTAKTSPPDYVPDDIKVVFHEAATCMSVECWNAASTMFRLSLDRATAPLLPPQEGAEGPVPNAKKRRDLGLRIPWLLQHGKLAPDLAELAGAVREDGNDGAHAGNLGKEDAEDLQDFTVELLERLYTEPGRIAAAAARRAERRQARTAA